MIRLRYSRSKIQTTLAHAPLDTKDFPPANAIEKCRTLRAVRGRNIWADKEHHGDQHVEITHHRRHTLSVLPQSAQFAANIDSRAVEQHVEDRMCRTCVIAQLVRKPHALRGGVVEVCCAVAVFPPHEAEYEPMGIQVLDGPWLDVVELDELEAFDPEPAGERREYTWIREQSAHRMYTYVQKD